MLMPQKGNNKHEFFVVDYLGTVPEMVRVSTIVRVSPQEQVETTLIDKS